VKNAVQELLESYAALPDADKRRVALEICRDQIKAEMDQASVRIQELMEEARKSTKTMMEAFRSEAVDDIRAERERFKREIEAAQQQALQRIFDKLREQ
jgi:uncharacterized coiled-coil DUF342 family protein